MWGWLQSSPVETLHQATHPQVRPICVQTFVAIGSGTCADTTGWIHASCCTFCGVLFCICCISDSPIPSACSTLSRTSARLLMAKITLWTAALTDSTLSTASTCLLCRSQKESGLHIFAKHAARSANVLCKYAHVSSGLPDNVTDWCAATFVIVHESGLSMATISAILSQRSKWLEFAWGFHVPASNFWSLLTTPWQSVHSLILHP